MASSSLLFHLRELRARFIYSVCAIVVGSIVSFFLYDVLINTLIYPLHQLLSSSETPTLFIHSFYEGFITKFKFSFLGGLILAFPFYLFHIVRFIFPGLKTKEKVFILFGILFGLLLGCFGVYLFYAFIIPYSVNFLTSSAFLPQQVGVMLNFNQNIFYLLKTLLYALLIFQLPILLFILLYLDLVKRRSLLKASRYVIVFTFVLTALVTPPDFVSQITLALPLISFYFLIILLAKLFRLGN